MSIGEKFTRISPRLLCSLSLLVMLGLSGLLVSAQEDDDGGFVDYVRQAFDIVRERLEEEHGGSLDYVKQWSWEETSWQYGIDDCVSAIINDDPGSARPIFIGWEFNITSLTNRRYRARISYSMKEVALCDEAPIVVDTGSGSAVAAPIATSAGGFELGGHVANYSDQAFSTAKNSGMTWIKKQVKYSLNDNPGNQKGLIDGAHANGFKILLSIVGHKEQMGDYNSYISQYANYVANVAALGADAIEVWNEPNIDREWPAGRISGGEFTRLLKASYEAIKSKASGTLVVSGAPSPTGAAGAAGCVSAYCNDDHFFRQMAAAGANQYMDCVGIHYNEGIISPRQQSGDPRGSYPTRYFSANLNRGYAPFGGTPVCITELGYLSDEGYDNLTGPFAWATNTTIAQHAQWLGEAVTVSKQSGIVRMMIVWNVDFLHRYDQADPQAGYAIIRKDGSCPACSQLRAALGG